MECNGRKIGEKRAAIAEVDFYAENEKSEIECVLLLLLLMRPCWREPAVQSSLYITFHVEESRAAAKLRITIFPNTISNISITE